MEESMEPRYDKRDVLQTLLDTSKLCTDLFDAVESDTMRIDRDLVMRVSSLTNRLRTMQESFLEHYLRSGRAGDDLLADVRASLTREDGS